MHPCSTSLKNKLFEGYKYIMSYLQMNNAHHMHGVSEHSGQLFLGSFVDQKLHFACVSR
jgi:hypothetical protein